MNCKSTIKKALSIGLISLIPFLVNADNISKGKRQVIKEGKDAYKVTKVSDSKNKVDGWYITDEKGNTIGDKQSERSLYRKLSCSANINEIMPDQIVKIRETRKNIEKIIEKKAIHDISKRTVEFTSVLEGILLNCTYARGTSLPAVAQKKIIGKEAEGYTKEFLQDMYDDFSLVFEDVDFSSPKEVEDMLKERIDENITLQFIIADYNLKVVEDLLKKDNRTAEENKEIWNRYIESTARIYAYSELTNTLMEDSTWINISKFIAKNISEGFTGTDLLEEIIKLENFQNAFKMIDENIDKIKNKNQRIDDRCNNKSNPVDDRFLDLLSNNQYDKKLNEYLKQVNPKLKKQNKEIKTQTKTEIKKQEKDTECKSEDYLFDRKLKWINKGCYLLDLDGNGSLEEIIILKYSDNPFDVYELKINGSPELYSIGTFGLNNRDETIYIWANKIVKFNYGNKEQSIFTIVYKWDEEKIKETSLFKSCRKDEYFRATGKDIPDISNLDLSSGKFDEIYIKPITK